MHLRCQRKLVSDYRHRTCTVCNANFRNLGVVRSWCRPMLLPRLLALTCICFTNIFLLLTVAFTVAVFVHHCGTCQMPCQYCTQLDLFVFLFGGAVALFTVGRVLLHASAHLLRLATEACTPSEHLVPYDYQDQDYSRLDA